MRRELTRPTVVAAHGSQCCTPVVSPNTQRRPPADTSKAATEGQCGFLAEQGSTTRVIEKFGHEQGLVAVKADAAEAQGMHKQVAVGATTDAHEAFATTAALVHGVRVSVSGGGLRFRSG